jgi:predicted PurR-regulated permease PerM
MVADSGAIPMSASARRTVRPAAREKSVYRVPSQSARPAAPMTPPPRYSPTLQERTLIGLLVGVSIAFAWVLLPFYSAVLWGAIIAIVFMPLHRMLLGRFKGRENWAALATLAIVLLIVILPLIMMTGSLVQEGARVVKQIQSGELNFARYFEQVVAALPQPVIEVLERYGLADVPAIQRRIGESMGRVSEIFATRVLSIGQDTLEVVVGFFITLYLAFFLLRDGLALARSMRNAIPLKEDDKRQLFGKFTTVIRATVKGNVVVAIVQGALGGVAFWVLGINAPMLWAAVMAFLSLLPAVGTALIWVPVAIYLVATGAIAKGLGLVAYGVLVIGLVDNVLRPILVGKDTKLPDYVVLISSIGGLALFGINGFVIGPMIAAMFVAVWGIFAAANEANVERVEAAKAPKE